MERNPTKLEKGPMRLYVGSLHFNINEEMLRGIFEPFGSIQSISLMMDYETGRSKGYGFVTYEKVEDAKKAMEQMNGFELAGRPMKVGNVTENAAGGNYVQIKDGLDSEETDKTGIDLGATGRLALMAKLAEGTGMKVSCYHCLIHFLNAAPLLHGSPITLQNMIQSVFRRIKKKKPKLSRKEENHLCVLN